VMGRKMITFSGLKSFKLFIANTFKATARFIGIRFNDKDVSDFFMSVVRGTIDYRAKTGYKRNDFMQLLIELMQVDENGTDQSKLTFNEIAAQAFVFFFAGKIWMIN